MIKSFIINYFFELLEVRTLLIIRKRKYLMIYQLNLILSDLSDCKNTLTFFFIKLYILIKKIEF